MARTAEFDPVVVDQDVGLPRLVELLARKSESAKLDFKETYHPGDSVGRVRMAKHVLAMANTAGGYIVMGVRDDGGIVGLAEEDLNSLDEAAIRQAVSGYATVPIALFLANRLEHEGKMFALLGVLPLQDRLAVAISDGQFQAKGGKSDFLFRAGDVLVRHGSSSERWNQEDADWILQRTLRASKDHWLQEFSSDFVRMAQFSGLSGPPPVDEQAIRKSPGDFAKLVTDLLRRKDG